MENGWIQQVIERLRAEILRPRIEEFGARIEELRTRSLEDVLEVLSPLFTDARREFGAILEVLPGKQLTYEQGKIFYGYTVSDFNHILPPDYPYIVGLSNIVSEQRMCFVYLYREAVTERFPEIPAGAVPIISVENAEDLSTGKFLHVDLAVRPEDLLLISPDHGP